MSNPDELYLVTFSDGVTLDVRAGRVPDGPWRAACPGGGIAEGPSGRSAAQAAALLRCQLDARDGRDVTIVEQIPYGEPTRAELLSHWRRAPKP
jgi:hypothetical protein